MGKSLALWEEWGLEGTVWPCGKEWVLEGTVWPCGKNGAWREQSGLVGRVGLGGKSGSWRMMHLSGIVIITRHLSHFKHTVTRAGRILGGEFYGRLLVCGCETLDVHPSEIVLQKFHYSPVLIYSVRVRVRCVCRAGERENPGHSFITESCFTFLCYIS